MSFLSWFHVVSGNYFWGLCSMWSFVTTELPWPCGHALWLLRPLTPLLDPLLGAGLTLLTPLKSHHVDSEDCSLQFLSYFSFLSFLQGSNFQISRTLSLSISTLLLSHMISHLEWVLLLHIMSVCKWGTIDYDLTACGPKRPRKQKSDIYVRVVPVTSWAGKSCVWR